MKLYLILPLDTKRAVETSNWYLEEDIRWMMANKVQLTTDNTKVLLMGYNSTLGSSINRDGE